MVQCLREPELVEPVIYTPPPLHPERAKKEKPASKPEEPAEKISEPKPPEESPAPIEDANPFGDPPAVPKAVDEDDPFG